MSAAISPTPSKVAAWKHKSADLQEIFLTIVIAFWMPGGIYDLRGLQGLQIMYHEKGSNLFYIIRPCLPDCDPDTVWGGLQAFRVQDISKISPSYATFADANSFTFQLVTVRP